MCIVRSTGLGCPKINLTELLRIVQSREENNQK